MEVRLLLFDFICAQWIKQGKNNYYRFGRLEAEGRETVDVKRIRGIKKLREKEHLGEFQGAFCFIKGDSDPYDFKNYK